MAFSKSVASFLLIALFGQSAGQLDKHYAVLSFGKSEDAAHYVSHWPRETINGFWTLSQSDVDGLEANIPHIADIPFPNPAYKGSQIPSL